MKVVQSITNCFHKMSTFGKVLIFITLLLIIVVFLRNLLGKPSKEGFIDESSFLFKNSDAVYDDFYASVYDYLVFNQIKNDYEVGIIINSTFANETSIIADIGCGTGHQVKELSSNTNNLAVIGVDISPSMIQKAKENYPNLKFEQGNALDGTLFKPESLTHVLCLYFTVYYLEDKTKFFQNAMDWLMSGGYLIVHLVDRYKFQPLLNPSNPLYIVTPNTQNSNNRITKASVNFDEFIYNANYKVDVSKDLAIFEEKFKFKDGKVRKQEQKLYMEDLSTIVTMAQDVGFLIHAKVDMTQCGYEYEYVYVFIKPT